MKEITKITFALPYKLTRALDAIRSEIRIEEYETQSTLRIVC